MRKMIFFLVLMGTPVLFNSVHSQSTCKVLMPRIGDSYKGECKQGLADGTGEAFGVDQYKGNFKKGLPEGKGIYIWQTGEKYEGSWKKGLRDGEGIYSMKYLGRDSVLEGIWKDDVYAGKKEVPDYVVQYRNNVGRVTCMKMGDTHNYVRFKFSRAGESSTVQVSDLMTTGSSGTESLTNDFVGYENVVFPFEGRLKFRAPSILQTSMIDCELRYVINEPGEWLMTIYY